MLGFGLDQFDAIGKFRQVDESGFPVNAEGSIAGYQSLAEPDFNGVIELGERLRSLPELGQCVVTQLFRHGFARLEAPADGTLLGRAYAKFQQSNYSFNELVVSLVTSDAFRYRERAQTQETWE